MDSDDSDDEFGRLVIRLVIPMSMIHQWFKNMCVRSVGGEMMYQPMSTRNYW